ncbi:MAG TPA: hypothetical protein VHT52_24065, partial [Stellaceae bacterium]|nr:hypothetical protein [Stellaceae bacterium]
MSDFGIGSQSGTDSGGGGFNDPSAEGDNFGMGDGFDPSAAGGPFGGSPFGGGGPFGGSQASPAQFQSATVNPVAQSAAAGQAAQAGNQQQRQQQNQSSRTNQLEDAIKAMFGGTQHAMSPTLQSLAGAAQTGMGWFPSGGGATGGAGVHTPDPTGNTAPAAPDAGAIPDMGGILSSILGLGNPSGDPAAASTGHQATSPVPYVPPDQQSAAMGEPQGDVPLPTSRPDTANLASGDAAVAADAASVATAPPAAPAPAADTGSAAPPSPQSGSGFGQQSGQPGPGDQVTGSTSSAEAANTGGQYGQPRQWQNNPMFALLDLLRGDFGGLMRDLMGQQGMPARQNQAGAPRPASYGGSPGSGTAAPAPLQAGPGSFGSATPGIAGLQSQGNLADGPSRGAATAPPTATSPQASASSAAPAATPAPQAASTPAAASPPTPDATAPQAERRVPTQRITGAQAVNLGNGQPANAPLTPQNYDAYLQQVGRIESGGNPNAVTGSNAGLYQFGPGEQRRYGITNWRDPAQQQRAMRMETNENTQILRRALGRDPTPGE